MMVDFVSLLENAPWPVIVLNESGRIGYGNPIAGEVLGAAIHAKGASLAAIWAPENVDSAATFVTRAKEGFASMTVKLRTPDGKSTPFSVSVCFSDMAGERWLLLQLYPPPPPPPEPLKPASDTAIRRGESVEAGVAQKQKLDCALQLARTVALDFNNALTTILGHTSLILSRMSPSHPWRSSLVEVEKSASKAAEIAHDLAAFSLQEKDTQAQVAGNINDVLRRTVELFQKPQATDAAWTTDFESRLYTACFDEAKLQQAFIKILDNAVQAIASSGTVSVRTRNHEVAQATQDGNARLAPGHYVCVEIVDTGCGVAPENLPRIFEPFFTTKSTAEHRGLGLALVYGIITNHGGSLTLSSQPGSGTTVRVYLPAQKKFVRALSLRDEDLRGHQTILMIDDEDLLLTMGETVLSSYGYRVLTANSGKKALEIFAQSPNEIDLVITDLVMPKMSGREVIERLRELTPTVRIICSSGYVRGSASPDDENYLQKPFTTQDLLRKVKEALAV